MTNWSDYPQQMVNAKARNIELRILTEEERIQSEKDAEQMWAADEAARCKCENPKPDEYTLAIDCGGIDVVHTPCGKQPWFMFDDWTDMVHMYAIPVVVGQVTGCSGPECCGGHCDCGPEVTLKLPGKDETA